MMSNVAKLSLGRFNFLSCCLSACLSLVATAPVSFAETTMGWSCSYFRSNFSKSTPYFYAGGVEYLTYCPNTGLLQLGTDCADPLAYNMYGNIIYTATSYSGASCSIKLTGPFKLTSDGQVVGGNDPTNYVSAAVGCRDPQTGYPDGYLGYGQTLNISPFRLPLSQTGVYQTGGKDFLCSFLFTSRSYVVGRSVFYDNSAFDIKGDDAGIATDKAVLIPGAGRKATFANYTSYSKGINGIMIDFVDLQGRKPTAADFRFMTGNSDSLGSWSNAPAPSSVTVRPGAGVGGSDRVVLTWGANAVKNAWLSVTIMATATTGLSQSDVFFIGNAVGETGDRNGFDAIVDSTDETETRLNPRSALNPAGITFAYDFNRDKSVNATDQLIARSNATTAATALKLIAP